MEKRKIEAIDVWSVAQTLRWMGIYRTVELGTYKEYKVKYLGDNVYVYSYSPLYHGYLGGVHIHNMLTNDIMRNIQGGLTDNTIKSFEQLVQKGLEELDIKIELPYSQ